MAQSSITKNLFLSKLFLLRTFYNQGIGIIDNDSPMLLLSYYPLPYVYCYMFKSKPIQIKVVNRFKEPKTHKIEYYCMCFG